MIAEILMVLASILPAAEPATIPLPTLGGRQFWADVHLFGDFRIQKSSLTDAHRLLDGRDRQRIAGSLADCKVQLAKLREEQKLQPWTGETVIVLHGIIRTRYSMEDMAQHLRSAGYQAYAVGYPSTQGTVQQHARCLKSIVDGLPDASKIHFVGHSMGGLVIRCYLADPTSLRGQRLGRCVMIGTPNHGAERADLFTGTFPYDQFLGPAGGQLVTGPDGIAEQLPKTPPLEFGVIAGGVGDEVGYSRSLPGDDDGTVTVASTRLAGARDFALVRCRHTFLMDLPQVHFYTATFLRHGYFRSPARKPIPAP